MPENAAARASRSPSGLARRVPATSSKWARTRWAEDGGGVEPLWSDKGVPALAQLPELRLFGPESSGDGFDISVVGEEIGQAIDSGGESTTSSSSSARGAVDAMRAVAAAHSARKARSNSGQSRSTVPRIVCATAMRSFCSWPKATCSISVSSEYRRASGHPRAQRAGRSSMVSDSTGASVSREEPSGRAALRTFAWSLETDHATGPEHRDKSETQRPFTTCVMAGSSPCAGGAESSGNARTLPRASMSTARSARRRNSRSGLRSRKESSDAAREGSVTCAAGSSAPEDPGATRTHCRSKPGRTERRCRERPRIRSAAAARHPGQPGSAKTTRQPLPVAGTRSSTGSEGGGVRSSPEINGPPRSRAIAVHQKAGFPTQRSSRA